MRATRLFTVATLVTVVGLACSDDATGIPSDVEVFTATMNGANEVPALVSPTSATGEATITVMENLVSWKVQVTGIENVTIGHIHFGAQGVSGGVMVDLTPTPGDYATTTTVALGSLIVVDTVLTHIRAGNAYVNIHTSDGVGGTDPAGPAGDYPGGEIRGQLRKP
jgi:hypothetical protein